MTGNIKAEKKKEENRNDEVKQVYQRKLVQPLHVNGQSNNNTSNTDINAKEQVRRDDAHGKDANGSSQHGQNSVLADRNDAATTVRDQPENQGISNSNLALHGQSVEILQDIVETNSKIDKSPNSNFQTATFEEEVTDLNLHKGKAVLINDDTEETEPNEDILSIHTDSLDISEGQEAKSKDELDLVTRKFTEELLSYFSELDCPNGDSKEPLSLQE
ncbi:hypothetical protein ACH5RR_015607 [Cinchona calisaya]|uniref:Uncharacterized protein n=1 Tax=Cinchona calisaya TaxID=153742 RepID=A0ABD2ZUV4_9GENT